MNSVADTSLKQVTCDLDKLVEEYTHGKKAYVAPRRKELGVITVPLIREIIAPAVFRQEDPEPLTATVNGEEYVRAIANKFKYGERARMLQVLRKLGLGGMMPQNRSEIPANAATGDYFDACTYIFGDSAMKGTRALSVRAAATYSCALSTTPEGLCVDTTFHNRANEWGTLYDEIEKKNSDNLYDRIFVKPGTLLLQVITFTGKSIPAELLDMYLTVLSAPFMAGGQTSVYGVNVKNHVVGVFGGLFEQAINSPYELLTQVLANSPETVNNPDTLSEAVFKLMTDVYPTHINPIDIKELQEKLIDIMSDDKTPEGWETSKDKVAEYFTRYFD